MFRIDVIDTVVKQNQRISCDCLEFIWYVVKKRQSKRKTACKRVRAAS